LKQLDQSSRQCPLCRTKLQEVRYAFTPEGNYRTHIPGRGDQLSDPFLRDDEIVRPGAPEEERKRRIELRRLRTLEDYDPPLWKFDWMIALAQEGETIIYVTRSLLLKLKQDQGILTKCVLTRALSLVTFQNLAFPIPDDCPLRPKEIAKAREEIKRCLESVGNAKPFVEKQFAEPEYEVRCDEKGLHAAVYRSWAISRIPWKEDMTIFESVVMGEKFLAELPTKEELEEDVVQGYGKVEREKELKLARQEIQGAIQMFSVMDQPEFRKLDRGSTGIFEVVRDGDKECQYCEVRHRNGECRLPRRAEE
jgi:hypothetical protein